MEGGQRRYVLDCVNPQGDKGLLRTIHGISQEAGLVILDSSILPSAPTSIEDGNEKVAANLSYAAGKIKDLLKQPNVFVPAAVRKELGDRVSEEIGKASALSVMEEVYGRYRSNLQGIVLPEAAPIPKKSDKIYQTLLGIGQDVSSTLMVLSSSGSAMEVDVAVFAYALTYAIAENERMLTLLTRDEGHVRLFKAIIELMYSVDFTPDNRSQGTSVAKVFRNPALRITSCDLRQDDQPYIIARDTRGLVAGGEYDWSLWASRISDEDRFALVGRIHDYLEPLLEVRHPLLNAPSGGTLTRPIKIKKGLAAPKETKAVPVVGDVRPKGDTTRAVPERVTHGATPRQSVGGLETLYKGIKTEPSQIVEKYEKGELVSVLEAYVTLLAVAESNGATDLVRQIKVDVATFEGELFKVYEEKLNVNRKVVEELDSQNQLEGRITALARMRDVANKFGMRKLVSKAGDGLASIGSYVKREYEEVKGVVAETDRRIKELMRDKEAAEAEAKKYEGLMALFGGASALEGIAAASDKDEGKGRSSDSVHTDGDTNAEMAHYNLCYLLGHEPIDGEYVPKRLLVEALDIDPTYLSSLARRAGFESGSVSKAKGARDFPFDREIVNRLARALTKEIINLENEGIPIGDM